MALLLPSSLCCRLMVYPPPPAKGGITVTNEDLHCLNDGEFLNDVIIDFYLKYVFMSSILKIILGFFLFVLFFKAEIIFGDIFFLSCLDI